MNIRDTIDNYMCSGCGMCSSICPKNAIQLQFNTIGNLIPNISNECINCGLCVKVCPGYHKCKDYENVSTEKIFEGEIINTFIGRSTNPFIYKNGQSGGIVTTLLKFLLDKKLIDAAIVAKCSYGDFYPITESFIVTNIDQLYNTQKSIYTPVDILSILKHVKHYKSIAIVGLPCQFEALKLAQDKGLYNNVKYKIGLICDRILSRSIYLAMKPKELSCTNYKVYFRDKSYPLSEKEYKLIFKDNNYLYYNRYKTACMVYQNEDITIPVSPYIRHHLKDFFTHPRCRICFNKLNIFADITCGDPWGMKNVDWQNGDSLVISRNKIGNELLIQAMDNGYIYLNYCNKNDVLTTQGIKNRIRRCLVGIEIFNNNGWCIPPVYKRIAADCKEVTNHMAYKSENKKVKKFIKHQNLQLDKILRKAEIHLHFKSNISIINNIKLKIKKNVKKIIFK